MQTMSKSVVAGIDPGAGMHAYVYNGSNQVILDTWAVEDRFFVKSFTWAGTVKTGESEWGEIQISGTGRVGSSLTAKFLQGSGAVQWVRTPLAGGAAADIANAASLAYVVKSTDRGYAFALRATSYSPAAFGKAVPVEVPSVPVMGAVSAGDARVTAAYTAPVDDGGTAVISADAELLTEGRPVAFLSDVANPVVFAARQQVRNGLPYQVRVRFNNAVGSGPFSEPSVIAVPAGANAPVAPGAPINVTLTAGDGKVSGGWTAPASTGGAALTGYRITPSVGQPIDVGVVTSYELTAANGVEISIRVQAINSAGAGPYSAASPSVTPGAAPKSSVISNERWLTGRALSVWPRDAARVEGKIYNPGPRNIEAAPSTAANNNNNIPSSGYVLCQPGQEVYCDDLNKVFARCTPYAITSLSYDTVTGIATAGTSADHPFVVDDDFCVTGGLYTPDNVQFFASDYNTNMLPNSFNTLSDGSAKILSVPGPRAFTYKPHGAPTVQPTTMPVASHIQNIAIARRLP
jgi:hypothetical protein